MVVLDLERFDKLSQALDFDLRVIRRTTTPGVNDKDGTYSRPVWFLHKCEVAQSIYRCIP